MEESVPHAALVPHALPVTANEPPSRTSRGERWFNTAVYGGMAGAGVLIATVPLAYYLKFGKGQWVHAKFAQAFEGLAKILPWTTSAKFPEEAAMTTTLMQGGNLMLLPIGVAEHYKVPIVEKLNHALGDPTPDTAVTEAPRQTWTSLIKARLTAWGVVFGSMVGASKLFPRSFETFENEFAERFCKLLGKSTHDAAGGKTKAFHYGALGALDVFATAAAATLLFVAGHIFARRQEAKIAHRPQALHVTPLQHDDAPEAETLTSVLENARSLPEEPRIEVAGEKTHHGPIASLEHAQAM